MTYFDDFEDCIRRNEILPDDMWDFDEKGFMTGRWGEKDELVSPWYEL